jgi:beta-glucosidase
VSTSAPAAAPGWPGGAHVRVSPRVLALLSQMTVDEKLSLLSGVEEDQATREYVAGYVPGVAHLGIPSLRLADGPPGVASRRLSTGMTQTMGVAATFSTADAALNGVVIGRDARALGQDVVLEPFVNLLRDPTWRRAFNTFGEDPLLAGELAQRPSGAFRARVSWPRSSTMSPMTVPLAT